LNKDEEDAPDAVDIPFGILPNSGEIVLLQMDGILTKAEWEKIAVLGMDACKKIYEVQKKALQEKFQLSEVADNAIAPSANAKKEVKAEVVNKKETTKEVKDVKAKKVRK
jgi:gamma-glutamyltranspeptidase